MSRIVTTVKLGAGNVANIEVTIRPGDAVVRTVLDLSTAHLPQTLGAHGLSGQDGIVAHPWPYGWLMWIPPDPHTHAEDYPDLPPEVLAVQRYARGLGCDFVLFDADADQVGDLPAWDW